MKVGDLVVEHIDDQIGIIIEVGTGGRVSTQFKILFQSGYVGWYPEHYLEVIK